MIEAYSSETNIYEHGIAVKDDEQPESLGLIATTKLPIYSGFNLAIVDFEGRSLNERAIHLANVQGAHYSADYYEEGDLRYCVLAALYHLNQLIDLYVRLCELFERQHSPGTAIHGNTSDPRVFYEIDAFLGAAYRVYEFIETVILKHYFPGKKWKGGSIENVINMLRKILPSFANELQKSWGTFGKELKSYRNCVAHAISLNDGSTTCWMDWYGNRWGVTIKLPANPDEQSRKAFDFDSGPEALSYCHSVACHLVKLCKSLESQTKIASYLANPRMNGHTRSP
jgi:hypothetical protein